MALLTDPPVLLYSLPPQTSWGRSSNFLLTEPGSRYVAQAGLKPAALNVNSV